MKVQALQGDTLDLLCQRHYGTTQGVTEAALEANKGLAGQLWLDAGQLVELPEVSNPAVRETVQLWN
ncbi:phage tail protein [Erwinia sp. E602]|uniref:tail protein X n=1 Tax=Erwinia sp. E602 TaxID=2675378 RepID=UPI001BAB64BE|nr:tail protein X [Erwinia sp. E602]QUG76368.1 phage tail protein [Erwinia sp. E602]